jgi:hypothetical protein
VILKRGPVPETKPPDSVVWEARGGGHAAQIKRVLSGSPQQIRSYQILLQKSKIRRRQKSRKYRFSDNFAAVMLSIANKKAGGRFSAK